MESREEKIVCFFNSHKEWGGGEKWHFEMASRLKDAGMNVIVCARPDGKLYRRCQNAGLKVYGFKISNLSFLNPIIKRKLFRFFKSHDIQHVILNLPSDLKSAGQMAAKAGVADIVYRRGSAIPIKDSKLNRHLFKNIVTRVIANSEETKQTIVANNQSLIDSNKISVIYNGIDIENFDSQEVDKIENKGDEIVLGNLGRMVHQKNQIFLIEVLKQLHEKGVNAKLRIGGDGDLKNEIISAVEKYDLKESVELPGFISDVKSFMSNIDIFLLSSHWEGFGYVLVEAQMCEKPVVAFNISSNPEVVKDQSTGVLVPPIDKDAFVDAIVSLIENPQKRQLMGRNGRSRAKSMFNIKQTTEKLVEFLHAK
ncbi:MAG: glycosyltransferase family 1 protein [Salinivirgaceae bacterium]|mgnify:CR=1 FL=1|nr:MAG: glycosyltransferase family 1 protein [Salinivirgaceae bacterium]